MRRAIFFSILILMASTLSAQVTARGTNVEDVTGVPLASGQWCFGSTCLTVTAGAFSGSVTAGTQTVTVKNGSAATILSVAGVVIAASPYNWDFYTVAYGVTYTGNGQPYLPCSLSAQYTQLDVTPNPIWFCVAQAGMLVWQKQGPQTPAGPGVISGLGVPTLPAVVPTIFVRTDVPSQYSLQGTTGSVSSTWGLIASGGGGGTTTYPLTMNNSGAGTASGGTFNGSTATTLSYNTLGVPGISGTPTAGHCAEWLSSTEIEDAGGACGSFGSSAWSSLTDAAATLVLDNAGYDSLFRQNPGDLWIWRTVVGTSGGTVSGKSPSLELDGTFYNGVGDFVDPWTIQNIDGTGTYGTSALTFTHGPYGTTGAATVSVPNLTDGGLTSGNCVQASTSGLLTTTAAPCGAGSTAWSSLTNATVDLALNNSGNNSEFQQISGDAWVWFNASSTSGGTVEQDSPALQLDGHYYDGSDDELDQWSIIDVVKTGPNPASTLTFSHNGSSGAVTVAVPALTVNSGTHVMDRCDGGTLDGAYVAASSTQATACTTGGGSLVATGIVTP